MNIQRDTEYRYGELVQTPEYTYTKIRHEFVDLGLPSGTLWAKMNVGAESETDYGLYFAWGETEGYTVEQIGVDKQFTWADYKFNPSGDGSTFTKYNETDNKIMLEAEDDAASVNMGGEWHMPNRLQCMELLYGTKNGFIADDGTFAQYTWDDNNYYSIPTETTAIIDGWNTAGCLFFKNTYISVTDAISAKDYLFIPAGGVCDDGEVYNVGAEGHVWTSVLGSVGAGDVWHFGFNSNWEGADNDVRCIGKSVRGVIGEIENPK